MAGRGRAIDGGYPVYLPASGRCPHMVVGGTAYSRPRGPIWDALFVVFFVLGGLCSTIIPLTLGSRASAIGKYLGDPLSGKTRDEMLAAGPEELGLADLPPSIVLIGAAIFAGSLLSVVIQKIEFPQQGSGCGCPDALAGAVACLAGGAALGCAASMIASADMGRGSALWLTCGAALPLSWLHFFVL
eukprot:SAG25_NODE_351_length_9277_cov_3.879712_2_plen_187_part_00